MDAACELNQARLELPYLGGGGTRPRLQILTAEALLAGQRLERPAQAALPSLKAAPKAQAKGHKQPGRSDDLPREDHALKTMAGSRVITWRRLNRALAMQMRVTAAAVNASSQRGSMKASSVFFVK